MLKFRFLELASYEFSFKYMSACLGRCDFIRRQQLKYFLLIAFLSLCGNSFAFERIQKTVKGLKSPVSFEKSQATRGSPTIYFDQATSSIVEMNKGVKFRCQQRYVSFGEVSLSIYCVTENEKALVSVGGELVKGDSAWIYSVDLEPEQLNDQLIVLIGALNN